MGTRGHATFSVFSASAPRSVVSEERFPVTKLMKSFDPQWMNWLESQHPGEDVRGLIKRTEVNISYMVECMGFLRISYAMENPQIYINPDYYNLHAMDDDMAGFEEFHACEFRYYSPTEANKKLVIKKTRNEVGEGTMKSAALNAVARFRRLQEIDEKLQKLEKPFYKLEHEEGFIVSQYDLKQAEPRSSVITGDTDSIQPTDYQLRGMEQCVVSHYHPKVRGPSLEDVALLMRKGKVTEVRVVDDEYVYRIVSYTSFYRPSKLYNMSLLEESFSQAMATSHGKYSDKLHQTWQEVAGKIGLYYTRRPRFSTT